MMKHTMGYNSMESFFQIFALDIFEKIKWKFLKNPKFQKISKLPDSLQIQYSDEVGHPDQEYIRFFSKFKSSEF